MRVTQLVAALHLSENTVRSALDDLRAADVVIERPVVHDARRRQYILTSALDGRERPAQRQLGATP